jgi:hypothetical protein
MTFSALIITGNIVSSFFKRGGYLILDALSNTMKIPEEGMMRR